MSQEDNESAPNLYIDFEDDEAAAGLGEAELVADPEAVGVAPHSWAPRWNPGWAWAALPARGRKLVAGAVVLAGLGAAVGDALVAQAAQRAADRPTVAVMDAAYSASADGNGLDLLVNVADTGTAPVTVIQAQVQQPSLDLDLRYSGIPLNVTRAGQLEIVLSGPYDCAAVSGNDTALQEAATTKVRLTLRSIHGTVSTIELPLPASAQLPGRWRGDRAGLCGWGY